MAAEPDRPDDPLPLQFKHVPVDFPVENRIEVGLVVDHMDHADIDVIGSEPVEQVLKKELRFGKVERPAVLAVFPDGAEVALHDGTVPPPRQSPADVRPDIRLRHENIEQIDPRVERGVHSPLHNCGLLAFEVFTAESDFRNRDSGSAELSVNHHPASRCN